MKVIPQKTENQTLSDYTEYLTDWYVDIMPNDYRKKKGQYFTPNKISELMVSLFENIEEYKVIRILDPGAGIGIFESTFCEYLKSIKTHLLQIPIKS